eukprot:scaffold137956_cov142-Phaeocystis_antarctica.AAC.1
MRVRSLHEELEKEEEGRQRASRLQEAVLAAVAAQRAAQRAAAVEEAHKAEAERDLAQVCSLAEGRLGQLRAAEAGGETSTLMARLHRSLAVQLQAEAARLAEAPAQESAGRAAQRL